MEAENKLKNSIKYAKIISNLSWIIMLSLILWVIYAQNRINLRQDYINESLEYYATNLKLNKEGLKELSDYTLDISNRDTLVMKHYLTFIFVLALLQILSMVVYYILSKRAEEYIALINNNKTT